jgi:hypothetical protein
LLITIKVRCIYFYENLLIKRDKADRNYNNK